MVFLIITMSLPFKVAWSRGQCRWSEKTYLCGITSTFQSHSTKSSHCLVHMASGVFSLTFVCHEIVNGIDEYL